MKGPGQILIIIYLLTSLYFLYTAAIGIFVYVANRSLGHYESFLEPGKNLAFGLIMGALALSGWKLLNNPATLKTGMVVLLAPIGLAMLGVLWVLVVYQTNVVGWK